MKAILLLCLIVALNCNLMDTAFCLIRNDKIKSLASQVIETIKNKNFSKLIEIALNNFNEVKSIVKNCLDDEPVLKEQSILPSVQTEATWKEVAACRIACGKDKQCLIDCVKAVSGIKEEVVREVDAQKIN